MKTMKAGGRKQVGLRRQTVQLLEKSASAIKKMSARDIGNLLEDLQIYQVELKRHNEELLRLQTALEAARKKYADLYDFAPIGYFTIDEKGGIAEVNFAGAAMIGVERDRLLGVPFDRFITEDMKSLFHAHCRKVVETAIRQQCEIKLEREGRAIYVKLESIAVKGDDDRACEMRTVVSDTTEQVLATKALRESERRYRALFENSREAKSVSIQGKIVEVNPRWLEMHGFSDKNEVIGRDVLQFIHEDDRHILVARRKEWPEKMEAVYEVRDIRKDGSTVYVNVYSSPIPVGGQEAIIATIHDIGDRKRVRNALEESEKKYRTLVETLSDIVVMVDLDGVISYLNTAFEKVTGFHTQELIGRHFREMISPEFWGPANKLFSRSLSGETELLEEILLLCKNGTRIPFEMTLKVLTEADGGPSSMIGIARDISQRKRLQEQSVHLKKMEAIATLSGGIAHQFNNALTSITARAELLEMDFSENQKVMKCVAHVKAAAWRMASMTHQLLTYGREGKHRPQPLSLSDLVESIIPILKHAIRPSIRLKTELSRELPDILADQTQMKTVISAIVANAGEAIEDRGCITVRTSYVGENGGFSKGGREVRLGPWVCLSVEDDGKGMDDKTRSKVFDPFFTTHFIGRGLGMSAAHGIVESHGGVILIESEPGKGTVVRVYLPVACKSKDTGLV